MGRPRLIVLIRHAQSEGNKDRAIHQVVPDHRVKLTDEGWKQAEDAGRRLKSLLRPDDTLQIFTSPYRRTRETTEGILRTLTSHDNASNDGLSPFSRQKIKVWEEPRLREQDFGNFQPCSAEMERMWRERADYGHFFYRIPNGESAADAYDRVSGFNESLWRQFGDGDFPSVCVLVTHGLMTRVFLMKWYHWSVEYFEDLRNINHCEFIVMKQSIDSGKFILDTQLRTWSELKRQKAAEAAMTNPQRRNTLSSFLTSDAPLQSPKIPARKWGGCVEGCNHHEHAKLSRPAEKQENGGERVMSASGVQVHKQDSAIVEEDESDDQLRLPSSSGKVSDVHESPGHSEHVASLDGTALSPQSPTTAQPIPHPSALPDYLLPPTHHAAGGTETPHEMSHLEEQEYFASGKAPEVSGAPPASKAIAAAMRAKPERKPTPEDVERWANESGMGGGGMADGLGDVDGDDGDAEAEERGVRQSVY